MFRTTQRELRSMIANGIAIDATHMPQDEAYEIARKPRTRLAYSQGVYGCNGLCFKVDESEKLYVIIGRCSNLWVLC